jgi:hypothetical protein
MLTLFEELFLLSIDDENGSPLPSVTDNLESGLSGSIIAELASRGKAIAKESHRLELVDAAPTGDEILDEAMNQIQSTEQTRKVTYWIKHFTDEPKKFHKRLVERLEAQGIVKSEGNRLSWVIPYGDSPGENSSAKFAIKSRLRRSLLTGGDVDIHDLILLSLVKACNVLNLVFTKDERKMARRRIYELTVEKSLKDPLYQSIQEIQAAVESQVDAD